VSRDAKGDPVYGCTAADLAVVQAIQELKARGFRVTFYPFVLWSAAIREHEAEPHGLLYPSRLNGETNLVLYDRAMAAMSLVEVGPLLDWPEVPGIIDALELATV
jgi:hypothetical protein